MTDRQKRELVTTAPAEDLDALIHAAEMRVIARDARVLQQGRLLRQRLASHGTQARLASLGAVGITATLLLLRRRRRNDTAPSDDAGGARHATVQAARPALWVQWLPLLLQMVTAGSVRPARPPGVVGWISAALSARERWGERKAQRPVHPRSEPR